MTTTPISFAVGNKLYYNSKDLQEYDPSFYHGCKTKPRTIVQKKKIPEMDYIYATAKQNEWNITTAECKKAQLLLSKSWVDAHFFKNSIIVNKDNEIVSDIIEENKVIDLEEVAELPPLLLLNDSEKFKDIEGNSMEIETRGEKHRNKILFKVSDVSKAFEMPNLLHCLTNNNGDYENDVHYKKFKRENIGINCSNLEANKKYKITYLTYHGLLRVLFVSRNKNVKKFQDWAEDKLFTHQMGNRKSKEKLASDLLGVDAKTIAEVFDKDANALPCVYFFTLGPVKNLRQSMSISDKYNDDMIVAIYGKTKDLARRTKEHVSAFHKIKGCELKLKCYSYIDPQYISKAESDVSKCMNSLELHLAYEKDAEMVVFNAMHMNIIEMNYENISKRYIGHVSELITQLKELYEKAEKTALEHKLELQTVQHEKDIQSVQHEKDIQKEKYEVLFEKQKNALLQKELEKKEIELKMRNKQRQQILK